MTYEQFKKKYNGKWIDYDGACGYQCWDLGQKYFTECLGVPASVLGGCGLVSNMLYPPKRKQLDKYFNEVKTPKAGDVAIWEYGHIAIYDYKNYYFSQNPNPCKVIKITTGGVHFFRLKGKEPTPIKKTITYRVGNGHWYATVSNGATAGNGNTRIDRLQVKGSNIGTVSYKAHILKDKWLPEVSKWDDTANGYAGIFGKSIDGIMVKASGCKIKYRVKCKKYGWLAWVDGYNTKDSKNGYAGVLGQEITAVEIKFV